MKTQDPTSNIQPPISNPRQHTFHWMLDVPKQSKFTLLLLFIALSSFPSFATDTNVLLSSWFAAQTNIQSWSADFKQTRTLKSLTQPLTATGHVWFAAPNQFRWELGHPPQTIAARGPKEMFVIYPPLKRAERYPLTGDLPPQWRDMLALLDAGFPRDQQDMDKQFKIIGQVISNDVCELALQPRSAGARKMMPQMKLAFGTNDFQMRATELQFADGSTMRNDFVNAVPNAPLDGVSFTPTLDADYKITEPLKK